MNLEDEIKKCFSLTQFCKILGLSTNGRGLKKTKEIIEKNGLDNRHFNKNLKAKIKYEIIKKNCPVCDRVFETNLGSKREKITCSYSCSNTFFRSGEKNPNWKEVSTQYRYKCFNYHKKECVICGEDKIVEVHHIDENRKNNNIINLIPLCPTHHRYCHSVHKIEIEEKINNYIKMKKYQLSDIIK